MEPTTDDERRRPLALALAEDRLALSGVAGGLAVVVGSVLPWASVPVGIALVTESGLEANGKLTLIAGVLALAFLIAALRLPGADLPISAGVAALGAAGIGLAYLLDVSAASGQVIARLLEGRGTLDPGAVQARFAARPGPGVWVVIGGGLAAGVSAAGLLARSRRGEPPGEAGGG